MCHLILLLPLIALPIFWLAPLSLAAPVYGLALLISGATYYYAMSAMRRDVTVGRESLIHARGKVVTRDGPRLSVRVQGELWSAHSKQSLDRGDPIEVVRINGLNLEVRRREPAGSGAVAPFDRHGNAY
jgi:membrane-bound ClpP family serine protease